MKLKVLGSGQDDGIPHIGCHCNVCSRARKYSEYRRFGPSIAIMDEIEQICYLIDVSPDFKFQLEMIQEIRQTERHGKIPVSGVLLTHAHLGHCAGLWRLGKESLDEKNFPVFCTPKMNEFLRANYPFSLLVQRRNIKIEKVYPDKKTRLHTLQLQPVPVPHRNEVGDTVGYLIESKKRVVYLPDIDVWTDEVIERIRSSDVALIDGTFYSRDEVSRYNEVPHPPILETISLLKNVKSEVYFTHINHTNPINKNGKERKLVEDLGFKIAFDNMTLEI